ncbi:F-box/RNI-like/FBD-like domains-containing protein [Rhynchospora pubera]|uniref:F-box/RNI-like/FBD-like domains-containing protein n=1 Tax=Rhynchospora pubera TaxID=906938 RepID=A0AAV8F8E2_9POAL|nr:F-box/RNI-like/FBD-like domains-containing protein [Rhynchospora pubera]
MENNLTHSDMISDLPDALLTHILSFMNPKEAVQTCILSKRWRTTWASMSVLRFDYRKFVPLAIETIHEGNLVKFVKFVREMLQNRESLSLDTFEFWLPNRHDCFSADLFSAECILLALKFKPRVFSVHASMQVILSRTDPIPIFTCASLQSISLQDTSFCHADDKFLQLRAVNLPHLKLFKLFKGRVNDHFFKILFSRCPGLEELELLFCHLHVSLASSEILKSLVLKNCDFKKKLVISTPNLVHLDIDNENYDAVKISLQNMASLVNASIQCSYMHVNDTLRSSNCGLTLHNHSSKFCMSDHTLESSYTKKGTEKDASNCSDFYTLKSLLLGCSNLSNLFKSINFFLHKSPNLKRLCLEVFPEHHKKTSEEEWRNARLSYEECVDALRKGGRIEVVLITESLFMMEERITKLIQALNLLANSTRRIRAFVFVRITSSYHCLR